MEFTMKNDKIFVLLLVILLPLTGCIDAVGEVDADSEENSGSSTVNNYYNNTTIESEGPIYEYMTFEVARIDGNGSWESILEKNNFEFVHLGSFNTTAGNLYAVIHHNSACGYSGGSWSYTCGVYIDSMCGSVNYQYQLNSYPALYSRSNEVMIKGTAGTDCVVSIYTVSTVEQLNSAGFTQAYSEIAFERIPLTEYQE